jgi:6-phosphofructo-2-kinase / fructose-2,6-biphosphatase 2
VKLNGPDYEGKDSDECVRDFRQRIKEYEDVYETIDCDSEGDLSWIKIQDCRRYTINNVRGYLPGKIIQFLMCLHTTKKRFFISR